MLTTTQSGQNGRSSPHTHWKPRGVRGCSLRGEHRSDILVRMRLVLFSLLILLVHLGAAAGQTSGPTPGSQAMLPREQFVEPVPASTATEASAKASRNLLELIQKHDQEIQALIDRGAFTSVWLSAFAAKDAALELEEAAVATPYERRFQVQDAVKDLVAAAWLLDLYGDFGDKLKLTRAYRAFSDAVEALAAAYETR